MITDSLQDTDAIAALMVLAARDCDEIAVVLEELGIVGEMDSPSACPVAVYLNRNTNYTWQVSIYSYCEITLGILSGKLPESVCKFANRFDQGYYPEIMAPSRV